MSEVYVFGIMDVIQLEPEEFTVAFAKSKIDCPRCKRLIEKAEKLLTNCSLLKKQDVAGICDHCWRQLARIQKLTRLTNEKENVLATVQAEAFGTQSVQAKRLHKGEVNELNEFKERDTILGISTQTHTSEGKDKTLREGLKGRGEKSTTQEEYLRSINKLSNARDDKLIAYEDSLRAIDSTLVVGKEPKSAKGKMEKIRAGKLMAQEKLTSQEELRTRDKKSKLGYEKFTSQEDQQTGRDKKSKARDETITAHEESSRLKDDRSTLKADMLTEKDKRSKSRGEKLVSQEISLSTKDKKSKSKEDKIVVEGKLLKERDRKTILKQGDEKTSDEIKKKLKTIDANVTHDEDITRKDKKSKSKDDKIVEEGKLLKERDRKSILKQGDEKMSDEIKKKLKTIDANVTHDEDITRKDKTSKAKDKKTVSKDEEQKGNKSKLQDEKPVTKEESKPNEGKPLRSTSAEQLKALILQEKLKKEKEKLEADTRKKQNEQEKKLLELAEKRAKEAALQQEKEAKAKLQPPVLHILESEDEMEVGSKHSVAKLQVVSDIIIGEEICKIKKRHGDKHKGLDTIGKIPTVLGEDKIAVEKSDIHGQPVDGLESTRRKVVESQLPTKVPGLGVEKPKGLILEPEKTEKIVGTKVKNSVKQLEEVNNKEDADGRIRYALSDRTFIDKGWTKLPLEKVVRKINVYRMRPSKPEFDWFEQHKNSVLQYDTGERLAEVDRSGRGRWYYRSGALAMDYYDAQETNAGQRFVVYSSEAKDARGRPRPPTVLATFDHAGNGIVFDHAGKTRLKYNQTEGIVLDQEIGPVSHWKWHTLNDPPVLQQVMIDTQLSHKDPEIARIGPNENPRPQDDLMLSIEHENFVKEKSKKLSQKFRPFQIKMKALKINENFSLRVLDQSSVYLLYRDGSTNLKINIGMLLDHKEIVDMDAAEIGDVANKMEKFPADTASILELQQSVTAARVRAAEQRARRARLAGVPESQLNNVESVEALHAGASRPLRATLAPCASGDTCKTCPCDV